MECHDWEWRFDCVADPGEAEYAVSVGPFGVPQGAKEFRRNAVLAQLEGSLACIGGRTPRGDRRNR
jgi:hypothetical protein